MRFVQGFYKPSMLVPMILGAAALVFAAPVRGLAQDKPPTDRPPAHVDTPPADAGKSLAEEIRGLRAKVAALEAALEKKQPSTPSPMPGMSTSGKAAMGKGGMGMMGGKGMAMMGRKPAMSPGAGSVAKNMPAGKGMGMMDGMMGGMGAAGSGSMPSQPGGGMMMEGEDMDMMSGMGTGGMPGGGMGMMDMDMMGMMGQNPAAGKMAMGGMAMPSALPGFPGASHLYHIGAAGFFLNHPQHITLTTEQQTRLNQSKEQALLAQAESQRKIDQAEQELWELTSADQPDATKIEAKVREIEKLRGDQRLAFIHAVGEAAKVLTPEQIKSLVGQAPPAGHTGGSAPQHQP